MLAYRAVQTFLRGVMGIFFREIHLVGTGNIPESGPVVFAGNHPNSLIDPVLVITTSGRVVHFAAKDKLFRWPLRPVLTALGAVPIARRMDHGEGTRRDNDGAIEAMRQVLLAGRAVGIFPEGISHDAAHLTRLRSGAARLILQAAADHPEAGACVVPCGLTYVHRKRFRSRVLVQYGPPMVPDATWVQRWRADPREAAAAYTDEIETGLRALTVNAPDWETLRVLDGVRRLYQPRHIALRDRIELARRFCQVYPTVRDAPDVRALYTEVERYLDDLDNAGLSDRDLLRSEDALVRRVAGNLAVALIWLPLAIPGAVIHAPLGITIAWAGLRFAPRKDVIGTSKLIVGLLAVLALYIALPTLAVLFGSWVLGLLVATLLPVSGYATLRVAERGVYLRRIVRSALAALTLRRTLVALRTRRTQLSAQVAAAVDHYRPESMAPLFPPAAEAE